MMPNETECKRARTAVCVEGPKHPTPCFHQAQIPSEIWAHEPAAEPGGAPSCDLCAEITRMLSAGEVPF